jgi:hypothetical protein
MPDEEIEKIEGEVQRAREDLSESLHQVNIKVEERLDVNAWVKHRPLLAVTASGAIGFVLGLSPRATLPTVAVLLGVAVGISMRQTSERA